MDSGFDSGPRSELPSEKRRYRIQVPEKSGVREKFLLAQFGLSLISKGGRATLDNGWPRGKILGIKQDDPIVLLFPGWTGVRESLTATPNPQNSLVAKIITAKPTALVIAMEGLGFGDNLIRSEISNRELDKRSGVFHPSSNASFLHWVTSEYLEIDPWRLVIVGHSWGGATVIEMARQFGGYRYALALAPAALIDSESRKSPELRKELGLISPGATGDTQRLDILVSARVIYQMFRQSLKIAEGISGIGSSTAETVFNLISPQLMGETNPGDVPQEEFNRIMALLKEQHKKQLTERLVVSALVMKELAGGLLVEKWTNEQLIRAAQVDILTGASDQLVTPLDVITFQRFLLWEMRRRAKTFWWNKPFSRAIPALEERLSQINAKSGGWMITNAGHMASLFSDQVIKKIISVL